MNPVQWLQLNTIQFYTQSEQPTRCQGALCGWAAVSICATHLDHGICEQKKKNKSYLDGTLKVKEGNTCTLFNEVG